MRPFLIAPLAVLVTTAASAQSVADTLFIADPLCFSRVYDDTHLATHPDQHVTAMLIRADTENMENDTTDDLMVRVEVLVQSNPVPYSNTSICEPDGDTLTCLMESDSGGFTLSRQDGRLRLDVGPNGMSFEGERDFLTLAGDQGDDRAFLLDGGTCD